MKQNVKDGLTYMTAAEKTADTTIVKEETAKIYVYETGKIYVSDGTVWHELGVADA